MQSGDLLGSARRITESQLFSGSGEEQTGLSWLRFPVLVKVERERVSSQSVWLSGMWPWIRVVIEVTEKSDS